jgi:hypothetical protein
MKPGPRALWKDETEQPRGQDEATDAFAIARLSDIAMFCT